MSDLESTAIFYLKNYTKGCTKGLKIGIASNYNY